MSNQQSKNLKGAKNVVYFLGPNGRSYYAGYKDGKIRIWDGTSHREVSSKDVSGKKGDRTPSKTEIETTAKGILERQDQAVKAAQEKNKPAKTAETPPTPREIESNNFGSATQQALNDIKGAGQKFDAKAEEIDKKTDDYYDEIKNRGENFGVFNTPAKEEASEPELTEKNPEKPAPETENLFSSLHNRFLGGQQGQDTNAEQIPQQNLNMKADFSGEKLSNLDLLKETEHFNTHRLLKYRSKEAEAILNKVENGEAISPEERLFLDKWLADINRMTKKEIMNQEVDVDLTGYRDQEKADLDQYEKEIGDWNAKANQDYSQNLNRIDSLSEQERARQATLLDKEGQVGSDDFYKTLKQKMLEDFDADKKHREALQGLLEKQQRQEDFILDKKIAGKGLFGTPMHNALESRGGALTPEKQMQLAMMESARVGKFGDMYKSLADADVAMNKENTAGQHKLSNVYGALLVLLFPVRSTSRFG